MNAELSHHVRQFGRQAGMLHAEAEATPSYVDANNLVETLTTISNMYQRSTNERFKALVAKRLAHRQTQLYQQPAFSAALTAEETAENYINKQRLTTESREAYYGTLEQSIDFGRRQYRLRPAA